MLDLHVDAPESEVAQVVEDAGAVVCTDRSPVIVQQNPGRPEDGWNGVLAGERAGTRLNLTYTRVVVPEGASALGWTEACPDHG